MSIVRSVFRNLSLYRALPLRERRVLLVSVVLLPWFWLGLRLAGLKRFQAWLERFPMARCEALTLAEAEALGTNVNRASNHVLGPANCLTRSLLLRWLLRRFGTASDLRIGVRFEGGRLAAHAWVEMDGIPVNDRPEVVSGFVAFDQPVSPELFS